MCDYAGRFQLPFQWSLDMQNSKSRDTINRPDRCNTMSAVCHNAAIYSINDTFNYLNNSFITLINLSWKDCGGGTARYLIKQNGDRDYRVYEPLLAESFAPAEGSRPVIPTRLCKRLKSSAVNREERALMAGRSQRATFKSSD